MADTAVGFCDTIKDRSSPQNGNKKVIQEAERALPEEALLLVKL